MKRIISFLTGAAMLFAFAGPVFALTQGEAKNAWIDARSATAAADGVYKQAQLDYQANKTPENEQKVVDSAKTLLNDALDEAGSWLVWKRLEAQEDSRVPADIKTNIENDVAKNLAKIDGLHAEVNAITNRGEVLVVFLKIAGAYVELLADVARNTGAMWSHIGDDLVVLVEGYEIKLRTSVTAMPDNTELLAKLDSAKTEIASAKTNIASAKSSYELVKLPGTPLIKFAEGNSYLRTAQLNLINAQSQLDQVYKTIIAQ